MNFKVCIIGIVIVIGIVFTSGCIGNQDPVIGNWEAKDYGGFSGFVIFSNDYQMDGSFTYKGALGDIDVEYMGTWEKTSENHYTNNIETLPDGIRGRQKWIYDPAHDQIYDVEYSFLKYTRKK